MYVLPPFLGQARLAFPPTSPEAQARIAVGFFHRTSPPAGPPPARQRLLGLRPFRCRATWDSDSTGEEDQIWQVTLVFS